MFYFFLYFNVFMYVFIYAAVLGLGCGVRALSSWPVTASGCVHLLAAALGAHGRPRALCRRGGLLSPAGPSFSSRGLVEMQSAGSRARGLTGSYFLPRPFSCSLPHLICSDRGWRPCASCLLRRDSYPPDPQGSPPCGLFLAACGV